MGITDRVRGVGDRLWLWLYGLDHDLHLDDDLADELDPSTVKRMDDATSAIDELFGDTGYTTAIYELEAMDEDDRASGRYNGVDESRPQIEIDPGAKPLPAIWAHEVGHHVADELDVTASGDTLLRSTFDELFAYLTAYTVMEETGGRQIYTGTPFRRSHAAEWQRLRDCFDAENREREDELLADSIDALEHGNWERLYQTAADLNEVEPGVTPETDGLSMEDYQPSMVTRHFFHEPEQLKYQHQILAAARRRVETLDDDEAVELLFDAYLERDDPLQERIGERIDAALAKDPFGTHALEMRQEHDDVTETVETIERDRIADVYDDILEDELAAVTGELEDAIDSQQDQVPDASTVYDELGGERYGYDARMEYRDEIDLPHSLGNTIAQELYDRGARPLDVVEDPATYEAICDDALAYTVEHGMESGLPPAYDLDPMLDGIEG